MMEQLVHDLMIVEWRRKGMPDARWQRLAERIAKKTGCSLEEIFEEWERQFTRELG